MLAQAGLPIRVSLLASALGIIVIHAEADDPYDYSAEIESEAKRRNEDVEEAIACDFPFRARVVPLVFIPHAVACSPGRAVQRSP